MAEELKPDICVIGGGPGGIALATAAANHGVSVVLIEKDRPGGANLARGAIPSKALIAAAGQYETLRRGPAIGVTGAPLQVNFGKLHEHIRSVAEAIAPNLSAERLTALGVEVIMAPATFVDRRTVVAGDTTVRARRFVVAVGAMPAPPPLPGLDGVDFMTVDAAFDVTRKPSHLLIYGADAHGLELAQAYARLGVDATVIDEQKALQGRDPELVQVVLDRLRAEGVRVRDGVPVAAIVRRRGGIRVTVGEGDDQSQIDGSHLLIVSGQRANIDGLGLDVAGIAHDRSAVAVDRQLRTTNKRVYAIGDAIAGPLLAGRAEYQASRVLRSILFRLPSRDDPAMVPAVVFTDPALATVGLDEAEARRRHRDLRILRHPFADNDRAQIERVPSGMIKVVVSGKGRILGVGVAGSGAGELIALWSLAIANRLGVDHMLAFAPPYPSLAEISRRVAASFYGPGLAPAGRRRTIDILRKFG